MDAQGSGNTGVPRRLPNPFVLKVIQDWGPQSPVAVAKDEYQPATGSIKTLRQDSKSMLTLKPVEAVGISGQDILKCKSLNNEDLAPVLRTEVTLALGRSKLLQKRGRKTL